MAGRRVLARTALVAGVLAAGGPAACYPVGRSLGWWGRPDGSVPVEVRNGLDVGVNLYASSEVAINAVFLGQVGPRANRKFTLNGHAPGMTVHFRAVPVDGRSAPHAGDVVLERRTVWQVPPR